MSPPEGERTPEMRQGRARLSVRDPDIEKALAGLNFDVFNIAETRRWGNSLAAAARLHQVGKIGNDKRRLSKADAARLLGMELSKLKQEGMI